MYKIYTVANFGTITKLYPVAGSLPSKAAAAQKLAELQRKFPADTFKVRHESYYPVP